MSRRIPKGAKKYSRILVTEDDGNVLSITNQVFEVFNAAGASIQGEIASSLRNDGTAAVEIYGLVNTTTVGFIDGEWISCKHTYTIDGTVVDVQVDPILVKEQKL